MVLQGLLCDYLSNLFGSSCSGYFTLQQNVGVIVRSSAVLQAKTVFVCLQRCINAVCSVGISTNTGGKGMIVEKQKISAGCE